MLVPLPKRYEIRDELFAHPFLKRTFSKLRTEDLDFIDKWIKKTRDMNSVAINYAANRLFMDQIERPKNWKIICEFASCFSTQLKQHETDTHPLEV